MRKTNPLLKNVKAYDSAEVTAALEARGMAVLPVVGGGADLRLAPILPSVLPAPMMGMGVLDPAGSSAPRLPPCPRVQGCQPCVAGPRGAHAEPSLHARLCAACGWPDRESREEGFGWRSEQQEQLQMLVFALFPRCENKEREAASSSRTKRSCSPSPPVRRWSRRGTLQSHTASLP